MNTKSLTTREVAELLSVTPDQVRDWISVGSLQAINVATKVGGRATWRVKPEALATFEKHRAVNAETPLAQKRRERRRPQRDIKDFL